MTVTTTEVRREIVVRGAPDRAFRLFTEHMLQWWPPEHHLLPGPIVSITVEPRVGGGIIDRAADGSESAWGRITAWDPPGRFDFAWMIDGTWKLETDIEKASRVSVAFTAEGDDTRVTLVHGEFGRMTDGGAGMAAAVGSPTGWDLARFAAYADAS